jgi:hypothetical protein
VIGPARFTHWPANGGGFVEPPDGETRAPLPNHINARADDVALFIQVLLAHTARSVPQSGRSDWCSDDHIHPSVRRWQWSDKLSFQKPENKKELSLGKIARA